ncbi:MAG TPA: M14 family metallopeptidase, partial [Anaerolineales bacterium]|nr:M14 family metallopeptidase [Anaerolineales bacterium]
MDHKLAMRLFPADYAASRARFRQELQRVKRLWPQADLDSYFVEGAGIPDEEDGDLSIDWISAPSTGPNEKLFILTTGEHGIEGFVGAGILQLFLEEFLERLNPHDTGLLLVHALNPWGMVHRRRANRHNVDLNRNFIWSPISTDSGSRSNKIYDPQTNPEYAQMFSFLNPQRPVDGLAVEKLRFWFGLVRRIITQGPALVRQVTLLGQYRYSCGIYYGGETRESETRHMMALYRAHFARYAQVVHLDMHTGYGPNDKMTLVNSWLEPRKPTDLSQAFAYPRVVSTDSPNFYRIRGDMIDWVYHLTREERPLTQFYAAAFEFGTLGASLPAAIRSLQTMILENQLYWHGSRSTDVAAYIRREFENLYFPQSSSWQNRAIQDARQAFSGILS